jgi:hypothetical protein
MTHGINMIQRLRINPIKHHFSFPFFFSLSGSLTPKSHMSYPLLCLSFSSIFPLQLQLQLQHHHHHLNMAQREGDPSASFIQAKQKEQKTNHSPTKSTENQKQKELETYHSPTNSKA